MPLTFELHAEEGYHIARITGRVSSDELIRGWESFLYGDEWQPGLNELTDLREADLSALDHTGMTQLAAATSRAYIKRGVKHVRVAVCLSDELPYGLTRMYEVMTEDAPEELRIFNDFEAAREWVRHPMTQTEI